MVLFLYGELGVINPCRRGKKIRAEMALRQRLAKQANATLICASEFDKSKSNASGGDYTVGVRK